ncbi:MAG: hypothetical protein KatS3mg015_2171 [Fimbriimonadales bacterium]|nr:MAG: hypothetical protein KatS3mg015_2171 [Fimbriimonadales bacterium]
MKLSDEFLARFLVSMLVMFFAGVFFVVIGAMPIFGIPSLIAAGSTLVLLSVLGGIAGLALGFTRVMRPPTPTKRGVRTRIPAKIYYKYRTDDGIMITDEDEPEGQERFFVVLMTKMRRRLEVETAGPVYQRCPEGMWGWAWVEGDWMGRFDPDANLHRQMED